jgi:hypothetical protein
MLQYSPKITTDGLVMCLDASLNKSYPTTDLPVKNGLLVWLDASDDSTFSYSSGTEVSQWRDKSGNNFHANQATTANQPSRSNVLNSRKTVNFSSSSGDFMRVSSGIVNPNYITVFTVIKPGTQGNDYAVILEQDHGNGYNGWVIQRNSNTSNWQSWVASAASDWFNPNQVAYTNNTAQIVTLRKNASTINLYSNGTSNGAVSISDTTITQTSYGLNLGYWQYGNGRYYNGEICEITVYNRGLSDTELKLVNTYLGQKWGISNTDRSVVDLTSNNYSGLLGNNTASSIPPFDYYNKGAFKLDGSNDYITTGISGIIPSSTSPYTVSTWVNRNRNNVGYEELLSQWTYANTDNSFFFGFNNSNVRFTDNWNDVVVSGAGNTNVWMNLVGVYSVSNAYIYLNGVLIATKGSGFTYTGTGSLVIGRQGELGSEYFNGNLSNVLIYNKALSSAEVLQNYEAQKSKFANSIVTSGSLLNLDAGNPYSYAGAGTTIYDVSGNNYSGSLISGSSFSTDGGGSITFNGTNQYVLASAITSPPTTNFTLNVWATFVNVTADRYLLSFGRDIGTNGGLALIAYGFDSVSDKLIFELGSGYGRVSSDIVPAVNTWYHIVVTADGTNTKIYINGVLKNTASQGTGAIASSPALSLGSYVNSSGVPSTYFHSGSIALFNLYNRALSDTEVLQNYNATKGRFGL